LIAAAISPAPEMLLKRFGVTSSVCGIVIEQSGLLSEAQWGSPNSNTHKASAFTWSPY